MADAVAVLPYDPATDRVLLIEQFRPALYARGDRNPWSIETVAGRIDGIESPEETALREAREEAGLDVGQLELVTQCTPIPGGTTERVWVYIGQAKLDGAGGRFGLPGEGEDIRAFTLTLDEAMAAIARGDIRTAPLLVAIYHLALHRDRIRAAWGAGDG